MKSSRIILALLFIVSLTCCTQSMQAPDNQAITPDLPTKRTEAVNIALVVPLSGENLITGQNFVHSTKMALTDLNNPLLKLTTFDSALPAHELAAKIEKINPAVIIGPIYSEETKKLASALKNKDLCIISFSNNSSSSNSKSCIFLLGIMPEQSLLKVIDYSRNQGYKTINILLPHNKYGHFVNEYLTKNNLKNIAFYETTSPIKEQLKSSKKLQELTRQPIDKTAILLPDSKILPELKDTNTSQNIKLIGGSLWESTDVYGLDYLNKSWFASLPLEARVRFEIRFIDTFGYKPLKIASLGYDAVTLIATLINNNGSIPLKKEELLNRSGFKGITGLFRFLPDGTNERSFSVYEINNYHVQVIDQAPDYFTN